MERAPQAKIVFRVVPAQCDDDFVIFAIYRELGAARFTGARELFPDLQARLASYGDLVPRILRVCLAWVLLSSALGMEPRFGVAAFTSPTLFAPAGPQWHWLVWAEVVLGLTILFGIHVRFFAAVLIMMALLGGWLFGEAILAYAGALIGASIYLVMQGAGRHFLPLPTPLSCSVCNPGWKRSRVSVLRRSCAF